ncbi:MAG TPA: hypothetical protein VGC11_05885 [Acidimicrobiia bacterium]
MTSRRRSHRRAGRAFGAMLAMATIAGCGGATAATSTTLPIPATSTIGEPATTTTIIITTTTTPESTSGPSSTAEPAPDHAFELTVAGGVVAGAPDDPTVAVGDTVLIVVTADVSDEVHVHGYDLIGEVSPGEPAQIEFTADIPGIFEVELEAARLPLLELRVE